MISARSFYNKAKGKANNFLIQSRFTQTMWAPSILFVATLFALPIYATLTAQSAYLYEAETWSLDNSIYFSMVLGGGNYAMRAIAMVFGIFTGWNMFSYLHSSSQVDLYHSLAISRRKLFLSNFIAGNIAFILPYLINAVIGLILFVGMTSYADMMIFVSEILHNLIFFNLFFLIALIGSLTTGTKVTSVLMTLVLIESTQVLLLGAHTLAERLLYTFEAFNWDWHTYTSPITLNFAVEAAWYTVFVVLGLFILSMMLFDIRPSEIAGQSVWGRVFPQFIKYYSLSSLAILGGIIFGDIGSSQSWMYFGFIFTIFFGHLIIEGIYHFDVKQVFRNWGGMIVFAVAFVALAGSFSFDFWKYDQRYTELSEVEYYEVNFDDMYYSASYLYLSDYDAKIKVDSEEGKAMVDQMIKKGIEGAMKMRQFDKEKNRYGFDDPILYDEPGIADIDKYNGPIKVRVAVKPKGRSSYRRVYRNIPMEDFDAFMAKFYDTQEFKMSGVEKIKRQDADMIESIHIEFFSPNSPYNISMEKKADIAELMKALEEDFLATSSQDLKNSLAILSLDINVDYDRWMSQNKEYPGYLSIPVFDCYQHTLDLLAKKNYMEYDPIDAKDILRAEIDTYSYEILKDKINLDLKIGPSEEDEVIMITDKNQIEYLVKNFAPSAMIDRNPFMRSGSEMDIRFILNTPDEDIIYVSYIER